MANAYASLMRLEDSNIAYIRLLHRLREANRTSIDHDANLSQIITCLPIFRSTSLPMLLEAEKYYVKVNEGRATTDFIQVDVNNLKWKLTCLYRFNYQRVSRRTETIRRHAPKSSDRIFRR